MSDQKWISVEERLPKEGSSVWVWDEKDRIMDYAIFTDGEWALDPYNVQPPEAYTHWQSAEKPEPPK